MHVFEAPGRVPAEAAIATVEKRLRYGARPAEAPDRPDRSAFRGRTWVTRRNVHVDRIASAWLIRRWIDERASFAFVDGHHGRVPDGAARARFSVVVYPDAFYTRFFESLLAQGAGRGTREIRAALDASRRSSFIVFERAIPLG